MIFKLQELKKPNLSKVPCPDTREPKILTDDYVKELNRSIAYRIRQREANIKPQTIEDDFKLTRKML